MTYNIIKKSEDVELSYSAIMRDLNKNHKNDIEQFRIVFKKTFDEANINNLENADKIALIAAMKAIDYNINEKEAKIYNRMVKLANTMADIGDPVTAGQGIASIIKFLLKRIDPMTRQQSTNKLRDRIWHLNELEMSSKKSPVSASIGQSISFIKNILNGRDSKYIRETLKHIVGNL
jgi:predicted transcriptional regulator